MTIAATRFVYLFQDGDGSMRDLLGGKGAGLAEMARAQLPVPPGFTITTEACRAYRADGGRWPAGLREQVAEAVEDLEKATGKSFGAADRGEPLLVSVRSGAKFSMPGMMDTILNLGLNGRTTEALARVTGDERFALDAYRRLLQMFGDVVLGVPASAFEELLETARRDQGASGDADLSSESLRKLASEFVSLIHDQASQPFPDDPRAQLELAISAVFRSWDNERARAYRAHEGIPEDLGTAVNVQAMVFGNRGPGSGTGVAFTRNPSTGERGLYGEYLLSAQGEDVVAGIRTPEPLVRLREQMPEVYAEFERIAERLERRYRDMQDLEFTIESGRLYMLQTRSGKRTAEAAVRIAVEMAQEALITRAQALLRVESDRVDQMLHRRIDPSAAITVLATGLPASPGAATGAAVFDADEAQRRGNAGEAVILVRTETTPDDVHGMIAAQGVLTARGGMTSHAAVVARGMGKPCVAGCTAITVDAARGRFTVDDTTVRAGEVFSLDGGSGHVLAGAVPLVEAEVTGSLRTLLGWADEARRLQVWANADYPADAQRAREYGAEGIGLCRTEHMFFEPDRLPIVQAMILAEDEPSRRRALDRLLPVQRADFVGILRAMDGLPVLIRLIDPPLHEFLPQHDKLLVEVTQLRDRGKRGPQLARAETMLQRVEALREQNPMMGLRGCRLGLVFPEIVQMQVRAILEAACTLKAEGLDPRPQIMVPLVGHANELLRTREILEPVAEAVFTEKGVRVDYQVGTMIEVPRGALTAGEIAEAAAFFSFGTNDLTQTTFAFSRDDAEGAFLGRYLSEGILTRNPFQSLDRQGVGELMRIAVAAGRRTNPQLEVGICGEHGGDPDSIAFCHELGLDYVSCSPFRMPVARLAAAQAALRDSQALPERDR